jgi:hypothetical protein
VANADTAAAAVALLLAPTAHADESSFLADLQAAGFRSTLGYANEIAVGQRICANIADGQSPAQVAYQTWLHTDISEERSAAQLVVISIRDLCPAYAPEIAGAP